MADVKAEVNRSIELEELKKMRTQFEDAARDVEQSVSNEIRQTTSELESGRARDNPLLGNPSDGQELYTTPPQYRHPKKNWRLKRSAMPQWYKRRHGIRSKALSGAARVARFRPRSLSR